MELLLEFYFKQHSIYNQSKSESQLYSSSSSTILLISCTPIFSVFDRDLSLISSFSSEPFKLCALILTDVCPRLWSVFYPPSYDSRQALLRNRSSQLRRMPSFKCISLSISYFILLCFSFNVLSLSYYVDESFSPLKD